MLRVVVVGSKMSNWQGGIRVNAFVSGGLLKTAAPTMIGTKLDGFTHACDWCDSFFCFEWILSTLRACVRA